MKTLHLLIIILIIALSTSVTSLLADSSVILTPFSISFSEKDFTKAGITHQILLLNQNESKNIHVQITNNGDTIQEISLSISTLNLDQYQFSYSFEPSKVVIPSHSKTEVLLHIKVENPKDLRTTLVDVVAKGKGFGITAKAFWIAMRNYVSDSDMYWIDRSLRESMPGVAFENIRPFTLEENKGIIPNNVFGIPKYLPQGYNLQGFSPYGPGPMLVYSPVRVTNATQESDFLHSGGMIVYYEVNGPNFNLKNWMPDYIAQNEAQQVIVNNITGVAIDRQDRQTDDYKFKSPAQIVLFKGNSEIELVGNMPLDELLKVASSIPISGMSENQTMLASCAEDKDWPNKPCNDVINVGDPNQKPILGDKQDWQAFYDMKGKDWMESKKQEMYFADQNGILKEWYEYGSDSGHLANSDVWYYYNLYDQSPDIMKYYNGTIQKDLLKPIITYYYASPIVFVIIGIAGVAAAFFISKISVKIRK